MTHKEFMNQSLGKFQFTPTRNGSYAIDTNFNFYFIHITSKDTTSINKIGANLIEVRELQHSLPIITFESELLNKIIALVSETNYTYPQKLENLLKSLEEL